MTMVKAALMLRKIVFTIKSNPYPLKSYRKFDQNLKCSVDQSSQEKPISVTQTLLHTRTKNKLK